MTTEAQKAANRSNAKRSTGPKSVSGKARVARNAVRHGATRAPDPEHVTDWFRVIMGRPELAMADTLKDDETTRLAFRLAGAEVRLASAQAALDEFEASPSIFTRFPEERETVEDVGFDMAVDAGLPPGVSTDEEIDAHIQRYSAMARREFLEKFDTRKFICSEFNLLRRYLREAQSQRKRAFADWIEHLLQMRNGQGEAANTIGMV